MVSGVPKRIQLRRTKGWRKPEGAVTVARPSQWGNPYVVGGYTDSTPEQVVEWYARALLGGTLFTAGRNGPIHITVADVQRHLAGRDLACWCPLDAPCHADVLLELANAAPSRPESGDAKT